MIPTKVFENLKLRISKELIRNSDVNGYTKLIVIVECFHSVAADMSGSRKLPSFSEIAEYVGMCRQRVPEKQRENGYETYSITRNGGIYKRNKNKVEIPAVLAMNARLDVYERLILIDLLAYRQEGFDDIPMREIGRDLGITTEYVCKFIRSLVGYGVLNKRLSHTTRVGGVCNSYEILDERLSRLCIEDLRKQRIKKAAKKCVNSR